MSTDSGISELEKDLLIDMSDEPHPDLKLSWGAWMTAALEGLKGEGYVKQDGGRYYLSEQGKMKAKEICEARYH